MIFHYIGALKLIDFVNGTIDYVNPEYIVVEVNGVGYQIFCPNPFIFQSKVAEKVKIYTYQYVREDVLALYGFTKREEKALFTKLLGVSGIGPKGALAILATGQPDQVVKAIEEEDEKFLIKFPGVGKKTARQMILDLKGKLNELLPDLMPDLFAQETVTIKSSYSKELDEAIEALKVLGYGEREINKVSPILSGEQLTTDQYVKRALQLLLNGR